MTFRRMIFNKILINEDNYSEIQEFDELIRELQDETLNEDWGYWHFSLLNLKSGDNLEEKIFNTLSEIPKYKEPYNVDITTGAKRYNSNLDLKNMTFKTVDLRNEIISKAEYWAHYQGPSNDKNNISDKFHDLKYLVADKIIDFLNSKVIVDCKLVGGIDTYYSFGGDHTGDDILIDTKSSVYIIHFGFSS